MKPVARRTAVRGRRSGKLPASGTLSASQTLTRYLLQHSMGRFLPVLVCFIAIVSVAGGCGSSDTESAAPPKAEVEAAFAKAPAPLRALYEQSNELLDGGPAAFETRLRELRGHPVVVNKWGSWCPPCRRELPFFQSQAVKRARSVAFLGVDAIDPVPEAKELLKKIPLSFPSYKDNDLKISAVFNGVASTPVTAFYDAKGELAYLKQGEYRSEQDLARDIERYGR
jgi:cytochrome c biogenesis protein CcmG, thiol:disulfide interchange protein DsbE